jgi:hypothetical protein
MSNPRFYAGELDAAVFTMSVAENASYPLSNLSTYVPSDQWRSSATTANQTLNIDMGTAVARDSVIIENHNFDAISGTHTVLQYDLNDNASFANPVDAAILNALGNGRVKVGFSSATKRYWRVLFEAGGALGAAPQLGQIFISHEMDAGQTYVYPYSEENETTPAVVRRSLSGVARSARTYGAITTWSILFDMMDDTFRTGWLRFHQKVLGCIPFYYADPDDSLWLVYFPSDVALQTIRYGRNKTAEIKMETQSTNQNTLA